MTEAALFVDAHFTGLPATLPNGITNAVNPTHVVRLTLSTGDVVVFGTVLNMLKLITKMRRNGQWQLFPQEDVGIALVGATKLILYELTFQNQRLFNAGVPTYVNGRLEFLMRSGSCAEQLDSALACVGHYRVTPNAYASTADLLVPTGVNSPRLIVVDYKYSETEGGTTFVDNPPFAERVPA